ncbi:MAG: dienelactone hydrolase family protein [Kofleriaceae bacterium]|jgi:dienelactone hydrolase|nr:dienelactone hydrolase family protein [Kofleriaceae bacterium]MBP9170672.1 dienelactone hydrolase family protein [Kofleriaceae bacterium]MBP9860908.1 dienelactone hydrolase family protein [Kofleriaceae bacterium]
MRTALTVLLFVGLLAGSASAKLRTKTVEYRDGDQIFEGYLAWDDAFKGKRPAVLVVHAWMGQDDNARGRADMLAKLGYIAFAADIYGKGVRPKDRAEAGKLAGTYKGDRKLLRARVAAGFAAMLAQPRVDPTKTAAIGYCFGGTTVLELARSGATVGGVVSFHGGLDAPTPADGAAIKAKVLALHGAVDPFVAPTDLAAFTKQMTDGKVDWQLVSYGGAVHCFTHKDAGADPTSGCAYDAAADARSWAAMRAFFAELFGKR